MNIPPELVEEYADQPQEAPRHEHECAHIHPSDMLYDEMDFDLDPTVGLPYEGRASYTLGYMAYTSCAPDAESVPYRCVICGTAPMTALSDYGWLDWSQMEDDSDEPEWCGLCWECAKPIIYGESV